MKDVRFNFLYKSMLGRDTNLNDTDEVIFACIKKAFKDMLTAGRFAGISDSKDILKKEFHRILKNYKYKFTRNLIDETNKLIENTYKIKKNQNIVTAYGMAQKLVNMTYKYLYVFNDLLKDLEIDFSNCDCPIDSIILNELKNRNNKKKIIDNPWSKMTKTEYETCQDKIKDCLAQEKKLQKDLSNINNLAFDFIAW